MLYGRQCAGGRLMPWRCHECHDTTGRHAHDDKKVARRLFGATPSRPAGWAMAPAAMYIAGHDGRRQSAAMARADFGCRRLHAPRMAAVSDWPYT